MLCKLLFVTVTFEQYLRTLVYLFCLVLPWVYCLYLNFEGLQVIGVIVELEK